MFVSLISMVVVRFGELARQRFIAPVLELPRDRAAARRAAY